MLGMKLVLQAHFTSAMFEAKLKGAIARTATKIHLFEKLGFLTC